MGRSDAIMILTLDNVHNKIKLISIMRDSYVNIDGYAMNKINHAYEYGGAELALKTLNENFGVNKFLPYIKTNISTNNLLVLATEFSGLTMEEIKHDRFSRDGQDEGQTINGVYYLTFDIESVKNSIKDYIFNDK